MVHFDRCLFFGHNPNGPLTENEINLLIYLSRKHETKTEANLSSLISKLERMIQ